MRGGEARMPAICTGCSGLMTNQIHVKCCSYRRAEVLAGFVNGIFLVFVAFFVFTESIERLMEPPEVSTDRLMLVSVLGFCVNLVGIFVFNHGYVFPPGSNVPRAP